MRKGTKLPFDVSEQRAIFYQNDMLGVQELKERLRKAIEENENCKSEDIDNPVKRGIERSKVLLDTSKIESKNILQYILYKLDEISVTNENPYNIVEDRLEYKMRIDIYNATKKYNYYIEIIEKTFKELRCSYSQYFSMSKEKLMQVLLTTI